MRIASGFLAFFLLPLLLAGCRGRAPEEEVWAEVNGKPIYRIEVEKHYLRQVSNLPEPLSEQEALGRKLAILNDLIQNEVLLQKAAQAGLLATDSEVEDHFQEVIASFSEEELAHQLAAQGTSANDLRADLRRDLSLRKLLDQVLEPGAEISDQEVRDYYEQYKNRFRSVETRYHVAYIRVSAQEESQVNNLKNDDARGEAEAQRKAQQLLARLRAGDDFAELARNYSEDPATTLSGGDLGFFPESALANTHPALRRALESLAVGAYAGPIHTPQGYHIVKLLEREAPGQRDLADVKDRIRQQLSRQKRRILEAAYIERARNQARVANYLARQILESHGVP